jgi:hypothetical protein
MKDATERNQIVSEASEENGEEIFSVSHYKRHADERTNDWILEEIKGAKVIFGEYGRGSLEPINIVEEVSEETIYIGVGGGKFDDHTGNEEKRKNSSAFLFAKSQGIAYDPGLKWILNRVNQHDKEAVGYLFDLPSVIKSANNENCADKEINDWYFSALNAVKGAQEVSADPNVSALEQLGIAPKKFYELVLLWTHMEKIPEGETLKFIKERASTLDAEKAGYGFDLRTVYQTMEYLWPEEQEENLNWLFCGLSWIYRDKNEFFKAVIEFKLGATVEEIRGPRNEKLRLAIIRSDTIHMHLVARSRYGCKAGVIIQVTSTGNIQIYTDHKKRIRLDEVAAILRYSEAEKAGKKIYNWKVLSNTGVLEEVPEWFLHEVKFMILNGALSAKDIPPTKLALSQIIEAVKIGINPRLFDSKRSSDCSKHICTSTKKNQCPLYGCGLNRCKDIRREKYMQK